MAQCVLKGASACGKRWQLVFHCAETDAHAAHACAELPPGRRAPRAVDTHSLNRDRFRVRTRTAVRDYLLSDNLVEMPSVERSVSFLTCHLPAGPRSGRTVLRLQSIPTSKRTNELLRRRKRGRRGRRRRLGGRRARGSAEDGAVPLTGRRCRCRARRGWCRARCGGGLRGMPLLRIQGRLPRRVRAERAHPQSGMMHKLCY